MRANVPNDYAVGRRARDNASITADRDGIHFEILLENRVRGGKGRTCLSVAGRGPWFHFNLRHLRVLRGVSRYCGGTVAFGVNCAEKHQNHTVKTPKTSIKTPKSSIKTPEKQSESIVNAPESSIKALNTSVKCI
jgi:hypothetical protein